MRWAGPDGCWSGPQEPNRCCARCHRGRSGARSASGPVRLPMPSITLSVNVNKVATLRNSRGGAEPDVLQAVDTCIAAGAPGITVHPRADGRHIRTADVSAIADLLKSSPDV